MHALAVTPTWDIGLGSWDPVVRAVPFTLGVIVLLLTIASLLRTVVIPRPLPDDISHFVARTYVRTVLRLSRLRRTYRGRDAMLSWIGPTLILVILIAWLLLFIVGYGLMLLGISDLTPAQSFVQAGSALFTLGIVGRVSETQTYVDFMAAATGPAVIALLIGFLPSIYSAFMERETGVSTLAALGGEPSWGPEFLARIHMSGADDELPTLYQNWTVWAARIRLTHTMYLPMNHMRSVRPLQSWITSLLTIMDAAALELSLLSNTARINAVTLLQEGQETFLVLSASAELYSQRRTRIVRREMRRILGRQDTLPDLKTLTSPSSLPGASDRQRMVTQAIAIDGLRDAANQGIRTLRAHEDRTLRLTREEFQVAYDMLHKAGLPIDRTADEAWEHFSRLRSGYEAEALSLARRFYAPPAPWSGERVPATEVIWPTLATEQAVSPSED